MATRQEVMGFLHQLRAVLPKFAPPFDDPGQVDAWGGALGMHSLEDLQKAFKFLAQHEDQFPSIARINNVIRGSSKESFDDLVKLISANGTYRAPEVSYRLAMVIERLGGWTRICTWTTDELPYRRKDFDEALGAADMVIAMTPPSEMAPILLTGMHTSSESSPTGQTRMLLAAPIEGVSTSPTKPSTFWDEVQAFFTPYKYTVDLNLSESHKSRGFFKLHQHPGVYFRFCHGQKPKKGSWPNCFVDCDEHMAQVRAKPTGPQDFTSKTSFDSSKYDINKFTD